MTTPASKVHSIAWWTSDKDTLPILVVESSELPKKMQDERKSTTLADPICVKLFEREDPFRIVDASTLKAFNDENNNKYKNGNDENAEEQKAQFIRAYYASQLVEDERNLVETDDDLGCFKCFSQFTPENETQAEEVMVCCDGCGFWFHLQCVGLKESPEGDYYCEDCRKENKRKASETSEQPAKVQA